jgi:hypothetical protein
MPQSIGTFTGRTAVATAELLADLPDKSPPARWADADLSGTSDRIRPDPPDKLGVAFVRRK